MVRTANLPLIAMLFFGLATPGLSEEVLYLTEIGVAASSLGGGSDTESQCTNDLPERLPIGSTEISMECKRNEPWGWIEAGLTLKVSYPLQVSDDAPGTFIGDAFGGYLWNVGYWGGSAFLSMETVGDSRDLTPECKEEDSGSSSGGGESTVNRSLHFNAKCEFTEPWWRSTDGSLDFTAYTEYDRNKCTPRCHYVEEIRQLLRLYLKYEPAPPGTSPLTVTVSGTGTGSVTSSPAGIDCGTDCAEFYPSGTVVTLSATPSDGSTFTGWDGAGCSGTAPCTVTVDQQRTVNAIFDRSFALNVTKTGSGTGAVTSTPGGIDCGNDCSKDFSAGTEVTLTATPASGSIFAGWSGGGCSGAGNCTVTMDTSYTVEASFLRVHTLELTLIGNGSGRVTSKPDGIDCGTDCDEAYVVSTEVELTASPSPGSVFSGWSGSGCSGIGTCKVTLDEDLEVNAQFDPAHTLSITLTGGGSGVVTSTPEGVDCGTECSPSFAAGTAVTLSATPASGSSFDGWSGGGCAGTGVCMVTLNSDEAVTAAFVRASEGPAAVLSSMLVLLFDSTQAAAPRPGDSCGEGQVLDCAMSCVDEQTALDWIGDGYCDDGTFGIDLTCAAFRNDDGDCETSGTD